MNIAKVRNFVRPEKVGSMYTCIYMYKYVDQKSLSCHAGHQEVSRCHTRDESEESIACRPGSFESLCNFETDIIESPKQGINGPNKKD